MRLGVFADVHGNAWALEAVLDEMAAARLDQIVFLGDALLRVPAPAACMALLRSIPHIAVMGNYDLYVLRGAVDGAQAKMPDYLWPEIEWTLTQLSQADIDYLRAMPTTLRLFEGEPQSLTLCHASPGKVSGGLFPATSHYYAMKDEECLALLRDEPANTILCAHTHAVMDRTVDRYRIINPGSVSLGWNERDEMDAFARWALLEWREDGWHVDIRRVSYDAKQVWQAYEAWELWPNIRERRKPRWWGEQARLFAMGVASPSEH